MTISSLIVVGLMPLLPPFSVFSAHLARRAGRQRRLRLRARLRAFGAGEAGCCLARAGYARCRRLRMPGYAAESASGAPRHFGR